jgi:hypothetical protein
MSNTLARMIHRFATDSQFRAQVHADPELLASFSGTLTSEDRVALLEAIEAVCQPSPAQSLSNRLGMLYANWPVNVSFTATAIA